MKPVATPPQQLFDYQSDSREADAVQNAVLTHWFTIPKTRERSQALLVDSMAGPFDGSQPDLKCVVVDSRSVHGSYRPAVPGISVVVRNGGDSPPLVEGELGIWIDRFGVMADGSIAIDFINSNHGYTSRSAEYIVRRGEAGWRAGLLRHD